MVSELRGCILRYFIWQTDLRWQNHPWQRVVSLGKTAYPHYSTAEVCDASSKLCWVQKQSITYIQIQIVCAWMGERRKKEKKGTQPNWVVSYLIRSSQADWIDWCLTPLSISEVISWRSALLAVPWGNRQPSVSNWHISPEEYAVRCFNHICHRAAINRRRLTSDRAKWSRDSNLGTFTWKAIDVQMGQIGYLQTKRSYYSQNVIRCNSVGNR